MDALTLLKQDHREIEGLFRKVERLGRKAFKARRRLVDQIIHALSAHAAIEEELFYPTLRQRLSALGDQVLQRLEEHHVVKWMLWELERLEPEAERFTPKLEVLKENILRHIAEEERTLFVEAKRGLKTSDLRALGAELAAAKRTAPTRPHPRAPDTPPGNLVAGAAAAVLDRGRDLLQDLRHRAGSRGREEPAQVH